MTIDTTTHRLSLPYLMASQAQKHVTHNEALRLLDLLVQPVVLSRTLTTEPASPAPGDAYIITDSAEGDVWDAFSEGDVAGFVDGAWMALTPAAGWSVFVADEGRRLVHIDGAWQEPAISPAAVSSGQVGVNTDADGTNRLSVKSDAVLFSHDDQTPGTGDVRLTLNKADEAGTASMLFQEDYEACFELGLAGGNDLRLRRSADGVSFSDCLTVSRSTGWLSVSEDSTFAFEESSIDAVVPPYRITADGQSLYFYKKTSDTNLAEGTRFVFDAAGGQVTGNPFWQGVHYSCSLVRESGASRYPRYAFYWSYTSKDDPTDLKFNIVPGNAGTLKTGLYLQAQNGGDIQLNGTRTIVGASASGNAKLCVDGAVKVKAFTVAALPGAASEGVGSIVHVSDEAGGAVLAFSDGTDWRRVTDRAVVSV